MTLGPHWEKSFVATSVAVGLPVDEALAALAVVPPSPPGVAAVADLVVGLRSGERAVRARTLAAAVHEIVLAVEETTLR